MAATADDRATDIADTVMPDPDDVPSTEVRDEPWNSDDFGEIMSDQHGVDHLGWIGRPLLVIDEREQYIDNGRRGCRCAARGRPARLALRMVRGSDINGHGHTKLLRRTRDKCVTLLRETDTHCDTPKPGARR